MMECITVIREYIIEFKGRFLYTGKQKEGVH